MRHCDQPPGDAPTSSATHARPASRSVAISDESEDVTSASCILKYACGAAGWCVSASVDRPASGAIELVDGGGLLVRHARARRRSMRPTAIRGRGSGETRKFDRRFQKVGESTLQIASCRAKIRRAFPERWGLNLADSLRVPLIPSRNPRNSNARNPRNSTEGWQPCRLPFADGGGVNLADSLGVPLVPVDCRGLLPVRHLGFRGLTIWR